MSTLINLTVINMDKYKTIRPDTRTQRFRLVKYVERKILCRPFTQSNRCKDTANSKVLIDHINYLNKQLAKDTVEDKGTIFGSRNRLYSNYLSFSPFLMTKNKAGMIPIMERYKTIAPTISREMKSLITTRKPTEANTILLIKSMTKKRRSVCRKLSRDTMTVRPDEYPLRITKLNSYDTKPVLRTRKSINNATLLKNSGNSINNENLAVYFKRKSCNERQEMNTIEAEEYFENNMLNQIYKH